MDLQVLLVQVLQAVSTLLMGTVLIFGRWLGRT